MWQLRHKANKLANIHKHKHCFPCQYHSIQCQELERWNRTKIKKLKFSCAIKKIVGNEDLNHMKKLFCNVCTSFRQPWLPYTLTEAVVNFITSIVVFRLAVGTGSAVNLYYM